MRRTLLNWAVTRASSPSQASFAALALPRLERAVPRTGDGAELVRSFAVDGRWAARFLAARSLTGLTPDLITVDEAWARLVALAADEEVLVREGAAHGLGTLVVAAPPTAARLEELIAGRSGATMRVRRTALRSLVVVAVTPSTEEVGARLLRTAALADRRMGAGVGSVILGRGIGRRDPERALRIAREWRSSDEPALRDQAERALSGPLAEVAAARGAG